MSTRNANDKPMVYGSGVKHIASSASTSTYSATVRDRAIYVDLSADSGNGMTITLPKEEEAAGKVVSICLWVDDTDSSETVAVKDVGGNTVATALTADPGWALLFCDGVKWRQLAADADGSGALPT